MRSEAAPPKLRAHTRGISQAPWPSRSIPDLETALKITGAAGDLAAFVAHMVVEMALELPDQQIVSIVGNAKYSASLSTVSVRWLRRNDLHHDQWVVDGHRVEIAASAGGNDASGSRQLPAWSINRNAIGEDQIGNPAARLCAGQTIPGFPTVP